ncbi:MAG TPA: TIGR02466 family protein [Alphaproteobacteria bacterium]|jgi:uncharacterized protein (TIGR02466 family)|nr:TIGR02466 family protein [Alphaproteobacteria bacterium]
MALNIQLNNGVILGFPTPLLRQEVKGAERINTALRAAILKRAKSEPSVARHNVGGWRSGDDLLTSPLKEVGVIKAAINKAIAQLTQLTMGVSGKTVRGEVNASAWATVCRPGDYVKPHIHPLSTWSGVYFVSGDDQVEGHPDSGILEFLDPRSATDLLQTPGNPFGASFKVKPTPGVLVVHPSWLVHFVNPYQGSGERITIGFNAFIKSVALTERNADDS